MLMRCRPGLLRAPHRSRGPCQDGVCVPSAGPQPSCVRGEACRRLLGLDLRQSPESHRPAQPSSARGLSQAPHTPNQKKHLLNSPGPTPFVGRW